MCLKCEFLNNYFNLHSYLHTYFVQNIILVKNKSKDMKFS
jgi:hypothetical protein